MDGPRWEHFEHGADIGVRGIGRSRDEAFVQAALALTAVSIDPRDVEPRERVPIVCEAPHADILFLDWLNAIIYEMSARGMAFGRFEAQSDGSALRGAAWGEPVTVAKHRPSVEVKAATFESLLVEEAPDGTWTAQCVVDV